MSRSVNLKTNQSKSLSTHTPNHNTDSFQVRRSEMPLCTCKSFMDYMNGSLTIEAAVILPLITCFLAALLLIFRVLQVETYIQTALAYSSRKTATMASTTDSDAALFGYAQLCYRRGIPDIELINQFVKGGSSGIDLWESTTDGDNIELVANYKITIPFTIFSGLGISIRQKQISKKWTGDCASQVNQEDPYVYITEKGEVYHTSISCRHIKNEITQIAYSEVTDARSRDRCIYYPCEKCAKEGESYTFVYITNHGQLYHTSLDCSVLKRTIQMVHLSEVGSRAPCKTCS